MKMNTYKKIFQILKRMILNYHRIKKLHKNKFLLISIYKMKSFKKIYKTEKKYRI